MIKFIGTKEEHKRFRFITITNKMHIWGECLSLYISGKTKMIDTLLEHVFRFCKKHQIDYDKPMKKQYNTRSEAWLVFKSLQEYQIGDLKQVIEKYNKVRKSKVRYEIY